MLNRFWIVAVLATVFSVCAVGIAQDKKKSGGTKSGGTIDVPESVQLNTYKPIPKVVLSKLQENREKTRGIDTGSSSAIFANQEALQKAIDDMGVKVIKTDPKYLVVEVSGIRMIAQMTEDNSFVLLRNWLALKEDVSVIPPQRLLAIMEVQNPLTCCWIYNSSDNDLQAIAAITAQGGTKQELRFKLDATAALIRSGIENLRNVLK